MKKVKLGQLVSIQTGKLDANAAVFGGKYPFFTTAKEISRINEYAYDGEVVLVAGNGDLNVKYYKGKFNAYQRTYILSNNSNVRMKYLYYFLDKYIEVLRYQSIGGVIKYIKLNNLSDAQIPMRSIFEQDKIIGILEKLDNEIIIRSKQLSELSNLVKSRFNEMFGDPISNSLKLPIKKFEKVVTLQRGFDLPIQNRQVGEINVWGSNGIVATHTESKVTEQGIVTGRSGSIGKVYVTEKEYWPLNTTLFSKELHGNNPIFLKYLLEAFKLERFNNGTGVPTLNRNIVHKEDIIYVPLSLQNEFADFVAQVDKSQFACQIVIKLWRNSLKSSII